MFAARFFAPRYFTNRYFPPVGAAPVPGKAVLFWYYTKIVGVFHG